jgi:aspartokinase-like uncharacterized kinase
MIVIKIGGSLIHRGMELVREIIEYSNSEGETILIVPGGSIFADTVRRISTTEEAAHWMAVLAMEQYGYYLGNGNDVELIDNLNSHGKGAYILLPYNLIKTKDELPHTWNVTSDTIAAWVAQKLGARFIKATDVDGIYLDGTLIKELEASELVGKETCVDAYLAHFLKENKMDCEIINGNCPGRLKNALKSNVTGTLIKG